MKTKSDQNKKKGGAKPVKKERPNSKKAVKKSGWDSSVSDMTQYQMTKAEQIQKRARLISANREAASGEWQELQKKLKEGVVDSDTMKVLNACKKGIAKPKAEKPKMFSSMTSSNTLQQARDAQKSQNRLLNKNYSSNPEMEGWDTQDKPAVFEMPPSYFKVAPEQTEGELKDSDIMVGIQRSLNETREFLKKMEKMNMSKKDIDPQVLLKTISSIQNKIDSAKDPREKPSFKSSGNGFGKDKERIFWREDKENDFFKEPEKKGFSVFEKMDKTIQFLEEVLQQEGKGNAADSYGNGFPVFEPRNDFKLEENPLVPKNKESEEELPKEPEDFTVSFSITTRTHEDSFRFDLENEGQWPTGKLLAEKEEKTEEKKWITLERDKKEEPFHTNYFQSLEPKAPPSNFSLNQLQPPKQWDYSSINHNEEGEEDEDSLSNIRKLLESTKKDLEAMNISANPNPVTFGEKRQDPHKVQESPIINRVQTGTSRLFVESSPKIQKFEIQSKLPGSIQSNHSVGFNSTGFNGFGSQIPNEKQETDMDDEEEAPRDFTQIKSLLGLNRPNQSQNKPNPLSIFSNLV